MADFDPFALGAIRIPLPTAPTAPAQAPFDPFQLGATPLGPAGTPAPDAQGNTGLPGSVYHGAHGNVTLPMPTVPEKPTAWESVGHGSERFYDGIHQLWNEAVNAVSPTADLQSQITGKTATQQKADDFTRQLKDEETLYQQGRGKDAGIDWASLAGSAAASAPLLALPGGGETALARAAGGALAGAADGGLQVTDDGKVSTRLTNSLIGGATGAVLAPIAGAAVDKGVNLINTARGRAAGLAANLAPEASATANSATRVTDEAPQILSIDPNAKLPDGRTGADAQRDLIAEGQRMISQTGELDADQLARKARLISLGLTPTTAMVTRDAGDWTLERNLQKLAQSPDPSIANTGHELTHVYTSNDAALESKLGDLSKPYGEASPEARGRDIMDSLGELSKQSQKDVSSVYQAVKDARGNELASDARNVVGTLQDPDVVDNAYSKPILDSVTARLKRYGMIDAEGQPTANNMTVNQAEEFRKYLQTLKSGDPKTDRVVTQFIKSTDADVLSGLGEDAFGGARAAAKARFDMLGNPATQKALDALGELNQGRTAQSFIATHVIGAPREDVQALLDTVNAMPPAARDKALNAIRGGVMDHLYDAAINPNSGQFSGAKLGTAMRKIEGGTDKLDLILGGQNAGQLRELQKGALDATFSPAYDATNHSGSGALLLAMADKGRAIPGVPLIINEQAGKLAARQAAANQLTDVLAARTKGQVTDPAIPPDVKKALAAALAKGAGLAGAQSVYQSRQPTR